MKLSNETKRKEARSRILKQLSKLRHEPSKLVVRSPLSSDQQLPSIMDTVQSNLVDLQDLFCIDYAVGSNQGPSVNMQLVQPMMKSFEQLQAVQGHQSAVIQDTWPISSSNTMNSLEQPFVQNHLN